MSEQTEPVQPKDLQLRIFAEALAQVEIGKCGIHPTSEDATSFIKRCGDAAVERQEKKLTN